MNRKPFRVLPLADADVDAHCAFIARDSVPAALRFVEAFYDDCVKLASMPGMGAKRSFRRKDLKDLRSWSVGGFENYLIIYKPVGDTIEVVRVLHGARNIDRILRRMPSE